MPEEIQVITMIKEVLLLEIRVSIHSEKEFINNKENSSNHILHIVPNLELESMNLSDEMLLNKVKGTDNNYDENNNEIY